jgi:O-succinylbenzoate synthase
MKHAIFYPYTLQFKKPATTSRGSMLDHTVYYIKLTEGNRQGWGECAPLPGLSIDDIAAIPHQLSLCCALVNDGLPIDALPLDSFPSIRFGFETAALMLNHDLPMCLFNTAFYHGKQGIPINGLVWMADANNMLDEAKQKIADGYTCIKFKVGALDFDEECRMIEQVRKYANAFSLEIRLDANGAFGNDEALEKLKELSRFEIHSIEQPIKPNQDDWMQEICAKSPIPIALDEDLIGRKPSTEYLRFVKPAYIILKPTLLGGLSVANQWIDIAQQTQTGWWATSALESNIGLNAIAQWCSSKNIDMPQGLGTGSLFVNNLPSPLSIQQSRLYHNNTFTWQIETIINQP